MSDDNKKIWARLAEPFPPEDLEFRPARVFIKDGQPGAFLLCYITARAVFDRLDDVIGPENWSSEISFNQDGCVAKISCMLGGVWVSKMDCAPYSDIEKMKGAASDALKRAAVQWRIFRYSYDFKEMAVKVTPNYIEGGVKIYGKTKDGTVVSGWAQRPQLPAWAYPNGVPGNPPPQGGPLELTGNERKGDSLEAIQGDMGAEAGRRVPVSVAPAKKAPEADSVIAPSETRKTWKLENAEDDYKDFPFSYKVPWGQSKERIAELKRDKNGRWDPVNKTWRTKMVVPEWRDWAANVQTVKEEVGATVRKSSNPVKAPVMAEPPPMTDSEIESVAAAFGDDDIPF